MNTGIRDTKIMQVQNVKAGYFQAESHEKEEMSREPTIKAGSGNERRIGHLDSNPEQGETEL
jgi:hypothetical protein